MSLTKLIEAVERGDMHETVRYAREAFPMLEHRRHLLKACDGSLDAANRLHDALLPGWKVAGIHEEDRGLWWVELRRGHITSYDKVVVAPHHFNSPTPARAWLLSILRALEQEGDHANPR